MIINKKVELEIRGLPLHSWSEDNLKLITNKLGSRGWWINRLDTMRCLENRKVCCYTNSLDRIYKNDFANVDRVGFHLKLVEVEYDFSKGNCVLQEESNICLTDLKGVVDNKKQEERSEFAIEDRDVVELSGGGQGGFFFYFKSLRIC